jgi:signal transduction histidine kinase
MQSIDGEVKPGKTIIERVGWGPIIILSSATSTSFFAALIAAGLYSTDERTLSFQRAFFWQASIYFLWAIFVPVTIWAGKKFRLERGKWTDPFPAYLLFGILLILLHATFTVVVTPLFLPAQIGERTTSFSDFVTLLLARLPIDILIYWAIVGAIYAAEYYSKFNEREQTAIQLEARLAQAHLQTLKMQLNPHFLFNTLQTINVLINKDAEAASRVTILLGDLLRKTLSRANLQEVKLRDELELVKDYFAIEQIRFSDRLTVEYDIVPEALDCLLPDLLLQPLVENALKHGIAPRPGAGKISIKAYLIAAHLILEVIDDGVGLKDDWQNPAKNGIGLANARARLQELYKGNHRFSIEPNKWGGVSIEIQIPVIYDNSKY